MSDATDDGWRWAIIEIMGHRSYAARVREVEQFGAKFILISKPVKGNPADHGWDEITYAASAIFSIKATDEATVMNENKPWSERQRLLNPPLPEQVEMALDRDDRDAGED